MIKRVGTCHPAHGYLKFEFKWGGVCPTIDAGIWKWHTLLVEEYE